MSEDLFEYREPAAIGVSFRRSGKIFYFAPGGLQVRQGETVLAQTERGLDIGEVVLIKFEQPALEGERELRPLLRKATPEDLQKEANLQLKEREARKLCAQKIEEHGLPMRLIAADYTFDQQRLVFYFSAESRVDFRELVRDLAELFHIRIELRQVGVRDQAKMIGGLGPCGRPLCCNAWLRNFDPVSIRVAKDQGLSLNPAKISGICDRLMCCLRYEHGIYKELAAELPRVGQTVYTQQGPATVKSVLLMHERLTVQYADGSTENLPASQAYESAEAVPARAVDETGEIEFGGDDELPPVRLREADRSEGKDRGSRPRRKSKGGGEGVPMVRPKASKARGAGENLAVTKGTKTEGSPAGEGDGSSSKSKRRRRPRRKVKDDSSQWLSGDELATDGSAESKRPTRPAGKGSSKTGKAKARPADTVGGGSEGADESKARRRKPRYRPRKKDSGPRAGDERE